MAAALAERGLLRVADEPPPLKFYVTDTAERFRRVAERFLEAAVGVADESCAFGVAHRGRDPGRDLIPLRVQPLLDLF